MVKIQWEREEVAFLRVGEVRRWVKAREMRERRDVVVVNETRVAVVRIAPTWKRIR